MDNNKKYLALATNLYLRISERYGIQKGEFSSENLISIAHSLGIRLRKISYDETNKIVNIGRKLQSLNQTNQVSKKDVIELEKLYDYFLNVDVNKQNKESQLEKLFRKLSIRSQEAIVNENEFDSFKEYMHIKLPIEDSFNEALNNHLVGGNKRLLFIIGNVGDGKSHLLSYMMKKKEIIFQKNNIKVYNDATETLTPTSTAMDTMKEVLKPFSDEYIHDNNENRLVVAINRGVLTNLIGELRNSQSFNLLLNYLKEIIVLSNDLNTNQSSDKFKSIAFDNQKKINFENGKLKNNFYMNALSKVFSKSPNNIFYQAYQSDIEKGLNKILHENYKLLLREEIKQTINYVLTRAEIEYKIIISTRTLFNFFYDITMPRDEKNNYNSYLPFLLFENERRSELLRVVSLLDPIRNQTKKVDETAIELYQAPNTLEKVCELLGDEEENFYFIFQSFKDKNKAFNNFINTFLRIKFLLDYEDPLFSNRLFNEYIEQYSSIQKGNSSRMLFELVHTVFPMWNGYNNRDGYVVKNSGIGRVKILVRISLNPYENCIQETSICLSFKVNQNMFNLLIDYKTYEILSRVKNGYFLKEEDKKDAITFDNFVTNVMNNVVSLSDNIFYDTFTGETYEITKFMDKAKLKKVVM